MPTKTIKTCDFCGREVREDRLALWPCVSFDLVHVEHDHTLYIGCDCHTVATLPADGTITLRQGMVGSWAACSDCRADIDADRWPVLVSRARAEHRRRRLPLTEASTVAMFKMFQSHRTPPGEGTWTPYATAVADAEQVLYDLGREDDP